MKNKWLPILGLVLLAACTGGEKPSFTCPQAGLAPDAGAIPVFNAAGTEMAVYAGFNGYKGACVASKGGIEIEITLDFLAKQGTGGKDTETQDFPYFIALLAPDETILQRQAFSTSVSFDNTGMGLSREEHSIRLPLQDLKTAGAHKVVFGFALTPEQLAFNKKKRPAKDPAPENSDRKKP